MQPLTRRLAPMPGLALLALSATLLAFSALLLGSAPDAGASALSGRVALGPDTPPASGPPAPRRATTAGATASASDFCEAIRRQVSRGGGASGVFVMDAETNRVLCRAAAKSKRILASNMKIFTTATALNRFGPSHRFETGAWRTGRLDRRGVLHGNIYLVGGGDPFLTSPIFGERNLGGQFTDIYDLVPFVRRAGIRRVTGRVYADDSIFDERRGVADSGYATSPYIGPLSGLSFNLGFTTSSATSFSSSPEMLAALKLTKSLRAARIEISRSPAEGNLPRRGRRRELGTIRSPVLAEIAEATNVYSNNFLAEMLMKNLGAAYRRNGSTAAGARVVEAFAGNRRSAVNAVDGSGLTRGNRASPEAVGRLLDGMLEVRGAKAFVDSLAVAGSEGTLAGRMGGTAAAGRCHAKTGTITGVSALSGYCFTRSGKTMIFSILNNGVTNLSAAHTSQDRIAVLVARR